VAFSQFSSDQALVIFRILSDQKNVAGTFSSFRMSKIFGV
jgi:hypothetical protein